MPTAMFELDGELGEIVIANPPLNLFSQILIADLHAAVARASASEARAVLLRAEGDVFSGGADVSIFSGLDVDGATALMSDALGLIAAIEDIPVPTVVLVQGRCFAGALEVALACDLIWAAAGAQIGQLEAVIGAFPFAGGTQRLAARIGAARTAQMVYGASVHSGGGAGAVGSHQPGGRARAAGGARQELRRAPGRRSDARPHSDQADPPRVAVRRGERRGPGHARRRSAGDPQQRPARRRGEPPAFRSRARYLREPLKPPKPTGVRRGAHS